MPQLTWTTITRVGFTVEMASGVKDGRGYIFMRGDAGAIASICDALTAGGGNRVATKAAFDPELQARMA